MAETYSSVSPLTAYEPMSSGLIPEDVAGVALSWFPKRHVIYSRFRHVPAGGTTVRFANERFRPRNTLLNGAVNNAVTTLTVDDSSLIDVDDVLKIDDEFFLVTATDPGTASVTVIRGHAASTAASHADDAVAWLVTNTRSGAAVNIKAMSRKATSYVQNIQVVMHAYGVGGGLESKANYSAFDPSPLGRDKTATLAMVLDDYEYGCIYGKPHALTGSVGAAARPMQGGLDFLIVTNRVKAPTNGAAYKPSDLIRDTLQAVFDAGGDPDTLLVSTDFLGGLSIWGLDMVRTPAGETELGVKITKLVAPWLNDCEIIPHPLLRRGSAICLDSREVCNYLARDVFDKPRGSRGDAYEGDIIMEGAIGLFDETHAAFVSGITNFTRGS